MLMTSATTAARQAGQAGQSPQPNDAVHDRAYPRLMDGTVLSRAYAALPERRAQFFVPWGQSPPWALSVGEGTLRS